MAEQLGDVSGNPTKAGHLEGGIVGMLGVVLVQGGQIALELVLDGAVLGGSQVGDFPAPHFQQVLGGVKTALKKF